MSLAEAYQDFTLRHSSVPLTIREGPQEYQSFGVLLDLQPDENVFGNLPPELTFFMPSVSQKIRIPVSVWPQHWQDFTDADLSYHVENSIILVRGYEYRVRGSNMRDIKQYRAAIDLMVSERFFRPQEEELRFNFQDWTRTRKAFSHYDDRRAPVYVTSHEPVRVSVKKRGGDETTDFQPLTAQAISRAGVLKNADVLEREDDIYVVINTEQQGEYQQAELSLRAY